MKSQAPPSVIFLVILLFSVSILIGAFLSTRLHNPATRDDNEKIHTYPRRQVEFPPLNCTAFAQDNTCPTRANEPRKWDQEEDTDRPSSPTCPDYFRWIHEDLRPWAETGITREMLKTAQTKAQFRVVIVDGKAYVETYEKAFQSRYDFTVWGILQLLRRYPGEIPDLDMMFYADDQPFVFARDYNKGNSTGPPPVFGYCGDDDTLNIVFPDFSFWGWPEVNVKPWEELSKDLREGNEKRKWMDREPYAYWKGNTWVSLPRFQLLKCSPSHSHGHDWNARIYVQDWEKESKEGFKDSNLANQCVHRYKVYIEGIGWSVSDKYILACDSMTLMVKPNYYDFFMRSLVPMHHYWPISTQEICKSIKFAVDWGNSHHQEAEAMGKAASNFIQEQLKMDFVYDYMFHTLNHYSKLLTFKPTRPPNAAELCAEAVVCPAEGLAKKFLMDSLVQRPASAGPCSLPPPFDPVHLHFLRRSKEKSIKEIENWEKS